MIENLKNNKLGHERIAKVMARAGLCSRREAERWIEEGRVVVNGETLKTPAVTVGDKDNILVNGRPLPQREAARLWRFHKPVGVLVAERTVDGRETIYDVLPKDMPRVIPVGRLDINSEGLLLLTNDGELKRQLELPQNAEKRRYRVRVHGRVSDAALLNLKKGITVEGVRYGPVEAFVEKQTGSNAWLIFTLTEGKNREIRKICGHLGLQVNRLIRQVYGNFSIGNLPRGGLAEVSQQQLYASAGFGMKPKDSWAKPKRKFIKPKKKPKSAASAITYKDKSDENRRRKVARTKT
jgi:23S rRNA pseudouridine2605 synthase